ncbi:MAG: DEAD/DEAH box helicase [Ilumatobacteraceae bacterium]
MTLSFADLGVPTFISDALAQRGIIRRSVQAATVADGLAGRDVCGRAPTGSGKTMRSACRSSPPPSVPSQAWPARAHAGPTRELADQITAELRSFSGRLASTPSTAASATASRSPPCGAASTSSSACPGRLEDLIQRGDVSLDAVDNVVLDEADRMADMGFLPVVRRLLDQTSDDRRTMLFSATLDDVAKLARDYQRPRSPRGRRRDARRHVGGAPVRDGRAARAQRDRRRDRERGVAVDRVHPGRATAPTAWHDS